MVSTSKKDLLAKRKGGAPRKYNPEIIIQEMLEWVKKESSINFVGFCFDKGYLPDLIWRLEKESQDFSDAYTMVKMKLAERRERMLNGEKLNYGSWQRYQKGYDPFLDKKEEEDAEKDAKRRKGIEDSKNLNLVSLVEAARNGEISQK